MLPVVLPAALDMPLLDHIVTVLSGGQDVGHGLQDLGEPPALIHVPRGCDPYLVRVIGVEVLVVLRELEELSVILLIEAAQDAAVAMRRERCGTRCVGHIFYSFYMVQICNMIKSYSEYIILTILTQTRD